MPQAIPFIVLAVSAAGAGVAAYSAVQQGEAAEEAGRYNQKVAQNNAEAAAQQARYESERIAKRNKVILGRQKAAVAKSGILDTGSTLDVFYDSAVEGELDRMAALYGGSVRSNYYQSQGKLARMEGDSSARANYYRAGGTLLTGAGNAASNYYSMTRNNNSGPSFED